MKVYETVIFMQGDDADEAFRVSGLVSPDGYTVRNYPEHRSAMFEHLMQWEYGEPTGDTSIDPPWGSGDQSYGYKSLGEGQWADCPGDEAEYVLSFHTGLTCCALTRVTDVDMPDDEVRDMVRRGWSFVR